MTLYDSQPDVLEIVNMLKIFKKVRKNTDFYVHVLKIDDALKCRYTDMVLRSIVDKHTISTKIALYCCFGRFFIKIYFCLKEMTCFIVKESGGKTSKRKPGKIKKTRTFIYVS